MSDQTIFNPEDDNQQEPQAQQAPDYSEYLNSVVNADGKPKYSTVEDALKALPHANQHISTLEEENRRLRDEVAKAQAVEDLVAKLQTETPTETPAAAPVSIDAIAPQVQQVVEQLEAQRTAQQNQQAVAEQLSQVFGEKAEEMYVEKAKELGVTPEVLNSLAGQSPKAVLSWFDFEGQTPPQKSKPSVNPEVVANEPQQPVQKRSVMGASSTEAVVSEWQRIKAEVEASINNP